jgi:hypothetical protein
MTTVIDWTGLPKYLRPELPVTPDVWTRETIALWAGACHRAEQHAGA